MRDPACWPESIRIQKARSSQEKKRLLYQNKKAKERGHFGEEEAANSVETAENLSKMRTGKHALGYLRISEMQHNMVIKDSGAKCKVSDLSSTTYHLCDLKQPQFLFLKFFKRFYLFIYF